MPGVEFKQKELACIHQPHNMRKPLIFPGLLAVFFICSLRAGAQNANATSSYDHLKTFSPLFYQKNGNEYRSASGMPGPKYWQNRADYKLDVTLDTSLNQIVGTALITYTNNSPDKMNFLWLYVEQNAFNPGSRSANVNALERRDLDGQSTTTGNRISSVTIIKNGVEEKAEYLISDTRLQIQLKDTLGSLGKKIQIKIEYGFQIPIYGIDRMGRSATKNGWIYSIAQWYPRMAVYDDLSGWNTLPYLGAGEFYLEYGDIDYTIHAPADLILIGSGELTNANEVLPPTAMARLATAKNSDRTIFIRDSTDVIKDLHSAKKSLSWHFSCKNTRDVAWAGSRSFIWDAARINLPNGKKALAQSVYPMEAVGPNKWSRSTEYIKASVEIYSRILYNYTYPVATAVATDYGGGMEYPGVVFNQMGEQGSELWFLATHEFGHNWFPMIVGSNERKYGWMDEGFNTFINTLSTKEFNNREYDTLDHELMGLNFTNDVEPIMTLPDVVNPNSWNKSNYAKPALALTILREEVLGEKLFDFAFRTYVHRWAFKHPSPWDFFHSMDNASGEDLSWFWNEWFFTDWRLEQSVKEVKYNESDYAKGAQITLENKEGMALPVELQITEENGSTNFLKLPVEVWMKGSTYTFPYASTSKITYVAIDPKRKLPNIHAEENDYSDLPMPAGISAEQVIKNYLVAIGGEDKLRTTKDLIIKSNGMLYGQPITTNFEYKQPNKIYSRTIFTVSKYPRTFVILNGDSCLTDKSLSDTVIHALTIWYSPFPEMMFFKKGYQLMLGPKIKTVDGHLVYEVIVTTPEGFKFIYYYDYKSGLKVRVNRFTPNPRQFEYDDYRQINNGIKIPFIQKIPLDKYLLTLKINSAVANSDISDDYFK